MSQQQNIDEEIESTRQAYQRGQRSVSAFNFFDQWVYQSMQARPIQPNALPPFDPVTNRLTSANSGFAAPSIEKTDQNRNSIIESPSSRFPIGWADTIGKRPTMEDAIKVVGKFRNQVNEEYLAVFDGHGGSQVANSAAQHLHVFLRKRIEDHLQSANTQDPNSLYQNTKVVTGLIEKAFSDMDENLKGHDRDGSTALVTLILGNKGYVAGAGDTRAVLASSSGVRRLSTDHKPDLESEKERIRKVGGFVLEPPARNGKSIARVGGILAVSRAFGDKQLAPSVTYEPEIQTFDINSNCKFLIIACDGIWDVFTDEDACALIADIENPEEAAKTLRDQALVKGSQDNISVIVVRFVSPKPQNSYVLLMAIVVLLLFVLYFYLFG